MGLAGGGLCFLGPSTPPCSGTAVTHPPNACLCLLSTRCVPDPVLGDELRQQTNRTRVPSKGELQSWGTDSQ